MILIGRQRGENVRAAQAFGRRSLLVSFHAMPNVVVYVHTNLVHVHESCLVNRLLVLSEGTSTHAHAHPLRNPNTPAMRSAPLPRSICLFPAA